LQDTLKESVQIKKKKDYEPLNFTSKAQFMRERSPQQLRAFPVEFWEVQYAFLLAINEIEYQLVKGDDAEALRLFKTQANPKASNTPLGAKLKDTSQGDRTGDEVAGERKHGDQGCELVEEVHCTGGADCPRTRCSWSYRGPRVSGE
jgi:hypothetical protein